MNNLKKIARYIFLALLIAMAFAGIPVASFLPRNREMDVDNNVKTELVEGKENTLEENKFE